MSINIISSAPIQTPNTFVGVPERYLTLLLPAFIYYTTQQLEPNNQNQLVLSFNGVGLSIQKKMQQSGFEGDLYQYNSHQIDDLQIWLRDNFKIEDYKIWRDDHPKFHTFLDKYIPLLLQDNRLKIGENECNICSSCGNIISLSSAEVTNKCNICSSSNIEKKRINCLCINTEAISSNDNYADSLFRKVQNPLSKVSKGVIKQRMGQLPPTLLASRTNRELGYPLDQYGLPGQQLDPEIGIALFPAMMKSETDVSQLIVQGLNTADRAVPYTELLDLKADRNQYIFHSKVPINTINQFLKTNHPYKLDFLTKYLPLILGTSSKDLSESDIQKLWKDFTNQKNTISNFSFKMRSKLESSTSRVFLSKEEIKLTSISHEQPDLLSLKNAGQGIVKRMPAWQKTDSLLVDRKELLPIIQAIYGDTFEVNENSPEYIIYKIKNLFKEDLDLAPHVISLIHFGSTMTHMHSPKSDVDIHLVIGQLSRTTYKKIVEKLNLIKQMGVNLDFSMHTENELLNFDGELVFRHGQHGIDFIYPLSQGTPLLGKNVYRSILCSYFDDSIQLKSPEIKKSFSDSEVLFKQYLQTLRKLLISGGDVDVFKKFFARALGTFLYSAEVISIVDYDRISSSPDGVIKQFLSKYGNLYNQFTVNFNQSNLANQDDIKIEYLLILEDLLFYINNPGNEFDLKNEEKFEKLYTRPGSKISVYKNKETADIYKTGSVEVISNRLHKESLIESYGFETPKKTTGMLNPKEGYIIESSFGSHSLGEQLETPSENRHNVVTQLTAQFSSHLNNQINCINQENISILDMTSKLDDLMVEVNFPEALKKNLLNFINKINSRLKALPKVMSHNDLHLYNLFDQGAIDWEYSGLNYLGYDLLTPFFFSGEIESGKILKTQLNSMEFDTILAKINSITRERLSIKLSDYFEDFLVMKIAFLSLYISDKPKLTSWRYPLFELLLSNYLNDIPNKSLLWPKIQPPKLD